MTQRQRAEACKHDLANIASPLEYVEVIEQYITAAEEECAKIAEEENERCESAADAVANNPFTTIDESTGHEMAAKAARRIMLKIRARSTTSSADTEEEKE